MEGAGSVSRKIQVLLATLVLSYRNFLWRNFQVFFFFFHRTCSHNCLGHFLGRIIAASYDKAVRAWDLETGKLLVSVPRPARQHGVLTGLWGPWAGPGVGRESSLSEKEGCLRDTRWWRVGVGEGKLLGAFAGRMGRVWIPKRSKGRSRSGRKDHRIQGWGNCTGKETLLCGVLGFDGAGSRAEAMGQRPRGQSTSVQGRVLSPSWRGHHPSIHPNQPETPSLSVWCPGSPGPAQGAPQGAPECSPLLLFSS